MMTAIWLSRLLLAAAVLAAPAAAQDQRQDVPPIYDRSEWLPKSVPTSDDVRRVPVAAGHNEPEGSFVLLGGRLFDGTGAEARPATIVVQGKTIISVLKPEERNWPEDAVVYDVAGKTVMPGLIDLHTHLTYVDDFGGWGFAAAYASGAASVMRGVRRSGIFLQAGITSVRDVGSHGDAPFVLKRLQASGEVRGPRVFPAGQLITSIGGHGAGHASPDNPMAMGITATGPEEWRQAVRIQFARGADLIKLASHFSQAEIDAAVAEAHSLGIPVTVDAETQFVDIALKAGVDSIEHPLPRSDEAIALMARRGVASVPTFVAYRLFLRTFGGYHGSTSRRFELTEATILEMGRKMHRAGVKMGIGLDVIIGWTDHLPGAYIDELRSFVEIGYSKREALVAATRTSAEILRMADRLGTIEPGKLADIIVVDGNPDEDFDALRRVDTAFVNGRLMLQGGRLFIPRHEEVPMPTREQNAQARNE